MRFNRLLKISFVPFSDFYILFFRSSFFFVWFALVPFFSIILVVFAISRALILMNFLWAFYVELNIYNIWDYNEDIAYLANNKNHLFMLFLRNIYVLRRYVMYQYLITSPVNKNTTWRWKGPIMCIHKSYCTYLSNAWSENEHASTYTIY